MAPSRRKLRRDKGEASRRIYEGTAQARIAGNGLSSLSRSGAHVVATSYDGGVYLVRPNDLAVVNVLRLMVQRVG